MHQQAAEILLAAPGDESPDAKQLPGQLVALLERIEELRRKCKDVPQPPELPGTDGPAPADAVSILVLQLACMGARGPTSRQSKECTRSGMYAPASLACIHGRRLPEI